MNGSEDSRLARVRAFKERKETEEKQQREKYRQETIDRVIASVYPKEKLQYFERDALWSRVYEYVGFNTHSRIWGDAYYERAGGERREAAIFRDEVKRALEGVPEENARTVISKLLDDEELQIAQADGQKKR